MLRPSTAAGVPAGLGGPMNPSKTAPKGSVPRGGLRGAGLGRVVVEIFLLFAVIALVRQRALDESRYTAERAETVRKLKDLESLARAAAVSSDDQNSDLSITVLKQRAEQDAMHLTELEASLKQTELELEESRKAVAKLRQELHDEDAKHTEQLIAAIDKERGAVESSRDALTKSENIAKLRNKQLERMQRYISDLSRELCEKRFGRDTPAHVLMKTSEGEMEIEMAPCSLMPVVTMHFIRQVDEGFWDGMVFFRAEGHVIQATDMRKDGSRSPRPKSHSSSIPFQEYSDAYPHHKYTLGIAGRPGGPDFYVNMMENVKIHGPGGQGHNYQGDPDSDSCFAKIVRGSEVADRIQKQPFKREGGLHILIENVEIISMTVL